MSGRELIEWIIENGMEDAKVYVDIAHEYKAVKEAWESEEDGRSVMLETE